MDKPVSIVIPCYNPGEYLFETLSSLEKCDPSLYEVIVVNDGSPNPKARDILAEVEKNYRVIHQENGGVGAARNTGVRAAKGNYILPLDQDNNIYPEYLTESLRILEENPAIAVVYGKRAFIGAPNTNDLGQPAEFDLARLFIGNYIDACAVIRKRAIEECGYFPANLPVQGFEDWDLWLSLAGAGWGFHFLDKVVYEYRIQQESMTTNLIHEDNLKRNTEFVTARHLPLFKKVFEEQYWELKRRRGWIPYWPRMAAKWLRDGPQS